MVVFVALVSQASKSTWPRNHFRISLKIAPAHQTSADPKEPRKLLGIWPEVFDCEPDLGLKLSQSKQAQNTRHGASRPARNDFELVWHDFGVAESTRSANLGVQSLILRPPGPSNHAHGPLAHWHDAAKQQQNARCCKWCNASTRHTSPQHTATLQATPP
jgi:hypothetical protein